MKTENLGIILLSVGGYFAIKKLMEEDPNPTNRQYDQAEKDLRKQGITPSFSKLDYQNFASVIYDKLRGHAQQDDKTGAANILMQMKNEADVIELQKAYGEAKLWTTDPLYWLYGNNAKTLMQSLSSEFYWPLTYLKTRVNTDWQQKGIQTQIP